MYVHVNKSTPIVAGWVGRKERQKRGPSASPFLPNAVIVRAFEREANIPRGSSHLLFFFRDFFSKGKKISGKERGGGKERGKNK